MALTTGDVTGARDVTLNIHRYSVVGDVFRSSSCSCRRRLDESLAGMNGTAPAILVYLIGPHESGMAFDHGRDCPARLSESEVAVAAQVIRELGPASIKVAGLRPTELRDLTTLLPNVSVTH
jgi:GTP cyclohydrolase II